MFFEKVVTKELFLNSYVIGCPQTKLCAVVDPCRNVAPILKLIDDAGYRLTHILETHVHADFISGSKELKHCFAERPLICCSAAGGSSWKPIYCDIELLDGSQIEIGNILIQAVHTPGHTFEHLSYLCFDKSMSESYPEILLSGDFLFVGGVGRADLLGSYAETELLKLMYGSLFKKLTNIEDYVELYPCHFAGSICGSIKPGKSHSTVGFEKLTNEYLQRQEFDEWQKKITSLQPQPSQLQNIKSKNLQGPALLEELTVLSSEGSIAEIDFSDFFLIDARSPDSFAKGHITDAINIPFNDTFLNWCLYFCPAEVPLTIFTEDHLFESKVISLLRLIGFDQPLFCISLSNKLMQASSMEHLNLVAPCDIEDRRQAGWQLIDVRSESEFNEFAIDKSKNYCLTNLQKIKDSLYKDDNLLLICKTGGRSSLAASLLLKDGFKHVASLEGGVQAYQSFKL